MIENCFLYDYNSITLQQLANQLGLSTRQTERMVHKQYGMSFKDKKQQARMGAASRLLLTTQLSIGEIAAQAGFATPEQFSNAFKSISAKPLLNTKRSVETKPASSNPGWSKGGSNHLQLNLLHPVQVALLFH